MRKVFQLWLAFASVIMLMACTACGVDTGQPESVADHDSNTPTEPSNGSVSVDYTRLHDEYSGLSFNLPQVGDNPLSCQFTDGLGSVCGSDNITGNYFPTETRAQVYIQSPATDSKSTMSYTTTAENNEAIRNGSYGSDTGIACVNPTKLSSKRGYNLVVCTTSEEAMYESLMANSNGTETFGNRKIEKSGAAAQIAISKDGNEVAHMSVYATKIADGQPSQTDQYLSEIISNLNIE